MGAEDVQIAVRESAASNMAYSEVIDTEEVAKKYFMWYNGYIGFFFFAVFTFFCLVVPPIPEFLVVIPLLLAPVFVYWKTKKQVPTMSEFHINLDEETLDVGFNSPDGQIAIPVKSIDHVEPKEFKEKLLMKGKSGKYVHLGRKKYIHYFTFEKGPGVRVKCGHEMYDFNVQEPEQFILALRRKKPTVQVNSAQDYQKTLPMLKRPKIMEQERV